MKKAFMAPLFLILFLVSHQAASQIPGWENQIQLSGLPSNHSVVSAYSDGYGQHVLTAAQLAGPVSYYLLGNDGSPLWPSAFTISSSSNFGAVTGYQEDVYIVGDVGNQIAVYRSSNGGSSWTGPFTATTGTTVRYLDAVADGGFTLFGIWKVCFQVKTKSTMFNTKSQQVNSVPSRI